MSDLTYGGWDHFNGGPWECMLPLPQGWRPIKKSGKTKIGDKCMVLIVPKRTLKNNGKRHKIKGKWELVTDDNVGHPVKRFRVIIRKIV